MDENLYQRQELMEIYKDPQNRGRIADPTVAINEKNPMCGDVIDLTLKIENDKITDAKFEGEACFVSIISSAMVTDEIIGKSVDEAKSLTKQQVLDLIGIELTTSRIKCATLVLEALQKAINEYERTK